jgi:hypothetical protein
MRPIATTLFALASLACAGERGPVVVFNESKHSVTLGIVWKNGVANPPISIGSGNSLRVQAGDQPPRSLSIAYGPPEPRTETVELREWVQLDAGIRQARPYAAFVVTDSKIQALSPDALSTSPRARLAREAPAVDVDAMGLRRAFDRNLDATLETIRARVAVGQSQRDIEGIMNDLHLAFSVDRERRLVSSFYPTPVLGCLYSGVLDVTFDESDLATRINVDQNGMCF